MQTTKNYSQWDSDRCEPLTDSGSGCMAGASLELERERYYQQLVNDSKPTATILSEVGGAVVHCSGALFKEYACCASVIRSMDIGTLKRYIFADDRSAALETAREARASGRLSYEQEFRAVKSDGGIAWIYETCRLVSDIDGTPLYLSVFVDVTLIREMRETLRIRAEEMNLAMEKMGNMLMLVDITRGEMTLSRRYSEKHGIPEKLSGLPGSIKALNILLPNGLRPILKLCAEIKSGKPFGSAEATVRMADGQWCFERFEFSTVFDSSGRPVRAIVSATDTTQRHQRETENTALRESERAMRLVASQTDRIVCRYDIFADRLSTDAETAEKYLLPADSIDNFKQRMTSGEFVLPESQYAVNLFFNDMAAARPSGGVRFHVAPCKDERKLWIEMKYSLLFNEDNEPNAAVVSFLNITEDHEKELAYEKYRTEILRNEMTGDTIIFEADIASDQIEKIGGTHGIGYPAAEKRSYTETMNYYIDGFLDAEDAARARESYGRKQLAALYASGVRCLKNDWRISSNDAEKWMHSEIQTVEDPYSGHLHMYAVITDITEKKLAELLVKKQAETDGMTGLYNRTAAREKITEALEADPLCSYALLLLDLDGLKGINDGSGHSEGDRAIVLISSALKSSFRRTDIVARIGGDEFMVFVPGIDSEARVQTVVSDFYNKLIDCHVGSDNDIPVNVSIGIVFGRESQGETLDTLFKKADRALYYAKRTSSNDYAFYEPDMEDGKYSYIKRGTNILSSPELLGLAGREIVYALSVVCRFIMIADLKKNSCRVLQAANGVTVFGNGCSGYDGSMQNGLEDVVDEDKAGFAEVFKRENMLKAAADGKKTVECRYRMKSSGGQYLKCSAVFIETGDRCRAILFEM